MSNWAKRASWDELIWITWFWPEKHASRASQDRYEDAVEEIFRRIPRVTYYSRVMSERVNLDPPLGTLPDWQPEWINDPPESTWAVRLLSNDGYYPAEPLLHDDGLIAADDELAWSAVFMTAEHPLDRGPISWLKADEVRFFGAYALAEAHPRTNGRPTVYTRTAPNFLHLPENATFGDLLYQSRESARSLRLENQGVPVHDCEPAPHRFDRDYTDHVATLVEAINQHASPVLLRGLYKLLMAREMFRLPHLLEEMALAAITSREAALELLRRKLSHREGKRLKKVDVIEKIRTEFPTGEPFTEVLEADWDNRNIIAHPVTEHGEFWSPPVEVEECYDTLTSLVYLYRYLLLDEIWVPGEYD